MKVFGGMDSDVDSGSDMEQEELVVRKFVDVEQLSIQERVQLVQGVQQDAGCAYFYVVNGDRGLEVRL